MELEHKGENFSMRWDQKEEILFIESWGRHTEKIAKEFCFNLREFWKKFAIEKGMKMCIDASKSIKTDHRARRAYSELTKEEIFLTGGTIAVYGANALIETITKFILIFIQRKTKVDVKFFTTKKEALKWLKVK